MKVSTFPIDGVSANSLVLLPCGAKEFPSWCDVYINQQLAFKNVFVNRISNTTIALYNQHVIRDDLIFGCPNHLVAMVESDNHIIIARPNQ